MDNNTAKMSSNTMIMNLLTLDNPVFCTYIFWCAVLGIKMLLMSLLTALQRFRFKVFPNPEDAAMKKVEVQFNDPNVERVRRAHRNDMENVLPYLSIGLMYVCVNPPALLATILFRIVAIARIIHTIVYAVYPLPQPTRAIAFFVQFLITIYMALHIIVRTISYI